MRVYEVDGVDGYEWVVPVNPADHDIFLEFDGSPRLSTWRPLPMKLVKVVDDGRTHLKDADLPWLGHHALVLRRSALEAIGDLLSKWGELLPLACDETELWVFHATCMLDALDTERSDIVLIPGFDDILKIKTHVFRPDRLQSGMIFKLSQDPRGSIFFRDDAADAVAAEGLTGLRLRPVWSDQ